MKRIARHTALQASNTVMQVTTTHREVLRLSRDTRSISGNFLATSVFTEHTPTFCVVPFVVHFLYCPKDSHTMKISAVCLSGQRLRGLIYRASTHTFDLPHHVPPWFSIHPSSFLLVTAGHSYPAFLSGIRGEGTMIATRPVGYSSCLSASTDTQCRCLPLRKKLH